MENNKGFINLITESDLFDKLLWEKEQLTKEPWNSYHAFNFFVTGYHLADWIFKGETRSDDYKNFIKSNIELFLTSQIANGAKHFSLKSKDYSDDKRGISRIKSESYYEKGYIEDGFIMDELIMRIKGSELGQNRQQLSYQIHARVALHRNAPWKRSVSGSFR